MSQELLKETTFQIQIYDILEWKTIAVKWSVHGPNGHDQLDHFSFGH